MKITYNGKVMDIESGTHLSDFITAQQLSPEGLAAAVNEEIIPKADYAGFELKEGHKVDIFTMVAGGQ